LPAPSPADENADAVTVSLPPLMAAKAALAEELRQPGLSRSELARRLGVDEKEVRRFLDPRHGTKLARLHAVLAKLGLEVELRVVRVAQPEIREAAPRTYAEIATAAEGCAAARFPEAVRDGSAIPVHELLDPVTAGELAGGVPVDLQTDDGLRDEAVCEATDQGLTLRLRTGIRERAFAGDGRARFTLAHALAHLALHGRDLAGQRGRAFRDVVTPSQKLPPGVPIFRSPEWQANVWAAALLMPEVAVRAYLRRLADEDRELDLTELARHFQVSREAASIRLEKLLPALVGGRARG
jgi:predicted transcriptional regulator